MPNLEDYLKLVNISDFDIKEYMDKLKEDDVPIVGMSVSGGGTQSGLGGLGIWRAFDVRSKEAVAARTGGLTQLLSYITGLSGGGAVTVSLLSVPDSLSSNLLLTAQCGKQLHHSREYRKEHQFLKLLCCWPRRQPNKFLQRHLRKRWRQG